MLRQAILLARAAAGRQDLAQRPSQPGALVGVASSLVHLGDQDGNSSGEDFPAGSLVGLGAARGPPPFLIRRMSDPEAPVAGRLIASYLQPSPYKTISWWTFPLLSSTARWFEVASLRRRCPDICT